MSKTTGALFTNRERTGSQPEYRGDFKLTKEFLDACADLLAKGHEKAQIAGWKKADKNGNAYLSLSLSPPYVKGEQRQQQAERPAARTLDDDIPF